MSGLGGGLAAPETAREDFESPDKHLSVNSIF